MPPTNVLPETALETETEYSFISVPEGNARYSDASVRLRYDRALVKLTVPEYSPLLASYPYEEGQLIVKRCLPGDGHR